MFKATGERGAGAYGALQHIETPWQLRLVDGFVVKHAWDITRAGPGDVFGDDAVEALGELGAEEEGDFRKAVHA